jgi:dTDP-4-dehydrorhamnose reductase
MALKILVTGGEGLLAHALRKSASADDHLIFLPHKNFDLASPAQMREVLNALGPQIVINTAAYNLVEQCEQERRLSWIANASGPETLARLCADNDVRLVHYSTDYVFDGGKKSPYTEADPPNPLNHYGAGKLAGERSTLAASARHLVLRTSWLFGIHPTQTKSYVHAVLRGINSGNRLKATTDQFAAPTFAGDLAHWTLELAHRGAAGLFHAVNDEPVSRYHWTEIILEEAKLAGLVGKPPPVEPVTTAHFKSPMQRPGYSALSNQKLAGFLGKAAGSWRRGLQIMLAQEAGR